MMGRLCGCSGNAATAVVDSSRGLQVSNESARSSVNFAYRLLNDRHGASGHWIVRDVGQRRPGVAPKSKKKFQAINSF
jgi:hypothetical protein